MLTREVDCFADENCLKKQHSIQVCIRRQAYFVSMERLEPFPQTSTLVQALHRQRRCLRLDIPCGFAAAAAAAANVMLPLPFNRRLRRGINFGISALSFLRASFIASNSVCQYRRLRIVFRCAFVSRECPDAFLWRCRGSPNVLRRSCSR